MKKTVVAVLNQKGGPGKTTTSIHIAAALQKEGNNTLLIDVDPQKSSSTWDEARLNLKGEDENSFTVISMGENIGRGIERITKGYEWVVIDGAPFISSLSAAAVKIADIVLIPVQPSPLDLWSSIDLIDLIKARQEVTDGLPKCAFVFNQADDKTILTGEMKEALEEYGIPVMETLIKRRQAYPQALKLGETVLDKVDTDNRKKYPHMQKQRNQAAPEIFSITKELTDLANV